MDKRPALGRGLSALIPEHPASPASTQVVDINLLSPNAYQPRGQMNEARLDDLASSIKANGVIQPIVVRREGERYHIIAGERRWRAAQRAGLQQVPIAVRDLKNQPTQSLLQLALVENIQRENLNPMDEAHGYRRLVDEFSMTQDAIAAAVGKDRVTVSNTLRLLKLPDEVQSAVAAGSLTMGHARALLALPAEHQQRALAREVVARGLSVRETESMVRQAADEPSDATSKPQSSDQVAVRPDVHTRAAEDRLKLLFGTKVRIVRRGSKGRIELDFGSEAELIRIFDLLTDGRS